MNKVVPIFINVNVPSVNSPKDNSNETKIVIDWEICPRNKSNGNEQIIYNYYG